MKSLLKFSYAPKDHEVKVKYSQTTPDGRTETVTLESAEEPRQELVAALQALAPFVCALCEFPAEWGCDGMTVRGVTINRSDETPGLTITALRALMHIQTPLVLNTPYTTEFGEPCAVALEKLEKLVLAYVDGERAQASLGLEKEGVA